MKEKQLLCVKEMCRIPDNTEYVTWQFPCLNLMWCQAGWNPSTEGKHWTIHLDKPVLLVSPKNTCKTGRLENANLIKSISSVEIRSGLPEKRQKLTTWSLYQACCRLCSALTHDAANATEPCLKHSHSGCLLLVLAPAKILLMASQVMSPDRFWSGLTVALRRWKPALSVPHPATSAAPCQRHSAGGGRSAWLT